MSDEIIATVTYETELTVPSVGIQGLSASDVNLTNMNDVDSTDLVDGSVLVYKTLTSKWTSTLLLDQQHMEGGEF